MTFTAAHPTGLVDNWRVLHGRRALTGERHRAGGCVDREDLDSTMMRTMRGRP